MRPVDETLKGVHAKGDKLKQSGKHAAHQHARHAHQNPSRFHSAILPVFTAIRWPPSFSSWSTSQYWPLVSR